MLVPFCEECARHWAPPSMNTDGTCPTCGRVLARPKLAEGAAAAGDRAPDPPARPTPKAPWHFKLLLASLVMYLGWRAWQGVAWLAARI